MKQVTVAAYMGAKYRLAPSLVKYMVYEGVTRYVDVFGGMGNLLLNKPHHPVDIYNDLDKDLFILFLVLSDKKGREHLISSILALSYDENTYHQSVILTSDIRNLFHLGPIVYAAYVWFLLLSSINGMRGAGFRGISADLNETTFKNKILGKAKGLEQLDGIEVENKDAMELIEDEMAQPERASKTMYFFDSPYLENRAGYACNMADKETHERYCELVGQLGGYRMVCGYDSPIYEDILVKKYGFYKYEIAEVSKTMQISKVGQKKSRAVEVIWTSYEIKGPFAL